MRSEIWLEYDSTIIEWGLPEETLERLLRERGLEGRMVSAGTDLSTGRRDVQYAITGSLEDVARVMEAVSADGIVSCRLREEEES